MTKHMRHLKHRLSQGQKYVVMAVLAVVSVAAVGSASLLQTHAAANNSLYFTPASGSYTVGSTVAITVNETSSSSVTAVEADFSYSSNLTYQSEDFSTSKFTSQPPGNGASGGVVTMQNSGVGLTGDQVVGVVNFVVNAPGTATLAFQGSSQLIDGGTGSNILAGTVGASYTLSAASGGGTPATTTTGGGGTPAAPPPSKSKSTSVNVTPKSSSTGVTVPNNSSVAVNQPVTIQPTTVQTQGVKKIEYYLNGKLVDTETKPPYKYNVDTTKLKNGTYQLVSKTYYTNGTTKQATQHLVVNNAFQRSSLWIYLLVVSIIILVIVGLTLFGPPGGIGQYLFRHHPQLPLSHVGGGTSAMIMPGPAPTHEDLTIHQGQVTPIVPIIPEDSVDGHLSHIPGAATSAPGSVIAPHKDNGAA